MSLRRASNIDRDGYLSLSNYRSGVSDLHGIDSSRRDMDNNRELQHTRCPNCYSFSSGLPSVHNVGEPQHVSRSLVRLVRSHQDGCMFCGVLVEAMVRCIPEVTKVSAGSVSWWRLYREFRLQWNPGYVSSVEDCTDLDFFQSPGSALDLALGWIAECTSKHELCRDNFRKKLPSRVLDLGTGDLCLEARVVTGEGKYARYGTLSHCWGRHGNHRVLTKATYNSWLQYFSIEELPQTYQDTIVVAKRIGLQYLWIDSLYIIQDDDNNWKLEASKMAEVYQNSYITIAATCAADSSSGMFSVARAIHRPRLIPYSLKGIEIQVYASVCLSHHTENKNLINSFYVWRLYNSSDMPLLSRAWVYQERLLSPRVLHFMREELVFECEEESRCECKLFPTPQRSVKHLHVKSLNDALKLPSVRGTQSSPNSRLHERWRAIVQEYTALSMTFEKDRLTAISGIAVQMQSLRSEPYFAGLWGSSFVRDLCWQTSASALKSKPKVWRAPSWSWAAVNDSVAYPTNTRVLTSQSAEVHRVVCNHFVREDSTCDELGDLESGWAEIYGSLCKGTLYRTGSSGLNKKVNRLRICTDGFLMKEIFSDIFLDYNLDAELGAQDLDVSCITLFGSKGSIDETNPNGDNGVVLILRKVPTGPNTYERIGLLCTVGEMFPRSGSKTKIKLI
ncbi:hypothetical protein VTL71DRAFT_4475 [Oculimacula yallundae]|uniref:Heterokaryon incompatibility domain-containing protein n=1 Tax=Oculimacula yallundae TaxID=86028 RepID=A0ABR4C392_9HELO